eukprot:1191280-Prorocentrum_minimum.AAC.1
MAPCNLETNLHRWRVFGVVNVRLPTVIYGSQSQGGRHHIPDVGANHRDEESIRVVPDAGANHRGQAIIFHIPQLHSCAVDESCFESLKAWHYWSGSMGGGGWERGLATEVDGMASPSAVTAGTRARLRRRWRLRWCSDLATVGSWSR